MKKIIILLLFLLNIFIVFANDKIDYSKYHLQGFFKNRDCYETSYGEICEKQYFYIYNNKIFLRIDGEMTYFEGFPDGIYDLNTDKDSKIKIQVKNGYIEKFDLLSNEKNFIKNEELIEDDNYCEIAYLESTFDVYNKEKKDKYFLIIDSFFVEEKYFKKLDINGTALLSNKINGKILVSARDYHFIFPLPNIKLALILDRDGPRSKLEPYGNNLKLAKNEEEADIIIENCIITYYNKDKEIFTEK